MKSNTAKLKSLGKPGLRQLPKHSQDKIAKTDNREESLDGLIMKGRQITGTRTIEAADRTFIQVANALVWPETKGDVDDLLRKAIACISEMAPQNATEAMFAVQMIATNDAALMFLKRNSRSMG